MTRFRRYSALVLGGRPFWRRVGGSPWLWGFLFTAALALLYHQNTRLPRYPYAVGEVADRDLVLDRDLAVSDPQETEKRRAEAVERVLPVFDWQPDLGPALTARLGDLFRQGRLGADPEALAGASGADPAALEVLGRLGYAPAVEDALSAVLLQVYEGPVVTSKRYLANLHQKGFVQRNLVTGEEEVSFDVFTPLAFPDDLQSAAVAELRKLRAVPAADREALARFVVALTEPNLTLNAMETNHRRTQAAEAVLPIAYNLPKGYVLARRGDVLDERAITILRELQRQGGQGRMGSAALGMVLLALGILLFLWRVIKTSRQHFYGYTPEGTFNLVVLFFIVLLAFLEGVRFIFAALAPAFRTAPLNNPDIYLYAVPFAAGAFLLKLLSGYRLSLGFAVGFSLAAAVLSPSFAVFFPFAFLGSYAAILSVGRIRSRWEITRAGLWVGGVNVATLVVVSLLFQVKGMGLQPFVSTPGPLLSQLSVYFWPLLLTFMGGLLSAAVVSFLAPIAESAFGLTTDLRLLEYTSQNHPLLKELAFKAPGTFQHSVQLATLAESAADAIGANGLLVRACCLFHDIGKATKPAYFIENQHGANPHEQLEPGASRLILKSHIMEGVEAARKHHLPRPIIDAILTHHGTKVMHYFYRKALTKGADDSVEETFRYTGPRPVSREMSIILLADPLEAAARTLDDPDGAQLAGMVGTLVDGAIADGQLADSELTFREVEAVKRSFIATLSSMYHARVDYPGFDFNGKKNGDGPSDQRNADAR
jgi:hypothetical protein